MTVTVGLTILCIFIPIKSWEKTTSGCQWACGRI